MDTQKPQDLDDHGKPFDEDEYFRKAGLTKPERTSKDRWDIARERFKSGHIPTSEQNAFEVRPANEWMEHDAENDEPVRKLFGDLWLEGELCILFADTAKGKSILAVQIAESIARARPIEPFEMSGEGSPEAAEHIRANGEKPGIRVLYIDFELSKQQFKQRYSGIATPAGRIRNRRFHAGHIRCRIKTQEVPPAFRSLGDFFSHSIRNLVSEYNASVLIIDNISWLRTSNTNASAALELMQELKKLKEQMQLSILVLAHTPKRPFARPLTVNDLAGSKMLSNFSDTMFAIGDSIQGPNIRYLKQIKPRNTELKYDATNVAVARIEKPSNFLKFTFIGHANEAEHLIRSHYHLTRLENDGGSGSPPYESGAPAEASPRGVDAGGVDAALGGRGGSLSASDAEHAEALAFRKKLIANCQELHQKGISNRQIAHLLGIGATTVRRYLSEPPA